MTPGNILLVVSFILSALGSISLFKLREKVSYNLFLLSFILLSLDMILLIKYFIATDFRYFYVYSYTSTDTPLPYRLAGVWAGQEGTYLLWAWIIALSIVLLLKKIDDPRYRKVVTLTGLLNTFFIFLTILASPFRTIYEIQPDLPAGFVPPDGRGLNPLLQDPWMAVHPPMIFIGYGFSAVVFIASIMYMLSSDRRYDIIARPWARSAWFFLTIGNAVGGYWSYKVLGWGGFWAWDPVETSSLIPWITITAYLHGSAMLRKKNSMRLYTPLLGILTFLLVVYATFITRSGLWESVHAFSETTTGVFLAGFLVGGIAMLVGVTAYHLTRFPSEEMGRDTERSVFFITVILLSILAFVSFWGITYPFITQAVENQKISIDREFFNLWSYPFTLALLIALGFCFAYGKVSWSRLSKLTVFFSALTVILLFITPGKDFMLVEPESPFYFRSSAFIRAYAGLSILSLFPPSIFSLYGVGIRFLSDYRREGLSFSRTGRNLIHLAIALILIGAVVSTSFETETAITFGLDERGHVKYAGDTGVRLDYVSVYKDSRGYWNQEVGISLVRDGRVIESGIARFRDTAYGTVTEVFIDRGVSRDVYVIFQGISAPHGGDRSSITIPLNVKFIPWISILWVGVFIMIAGMTLILIRDVKRPSGRENREVGKKVKGRAKSL